MKRVVVVAATSALALVPVACGADRDPSIAVGVVREKSVFGADDRRDCSAAGVCVATPGAPADAGADASTDAALTPAPKPTPDSPASAVDSPSSASRGDDDGCAIGRGGASSHGIGGFAMAVLVSSLSLARKRLCRSL